MQSGQNYFKTYTEVLWLYSACKVALGGHPTLGKLGQLSPTPKKEDMREISSLPEKVHAKNLE